MAPLNGAIATRMPRYAKTPIVEAVLELQFAAPHTDRDLERLRDKFKSRYPAVKKQHDVEVQVMDSDGRSDVRSTLSGYQLSSADGLAGLLIRRQALGSIKYPPYEDWEDLVRSANTNYQLYNKVLPRPKITRIGTRFVNRIDIPDSEILGHEVEEFFNTYIKYGDGSIKDTYAFGITSSVTDALTGSRVTLRMGTASPALIDHQSFMVDIDVYETRDIPTKIDDVWRAFDKLRMAKNNIFEACLTEKTKALCLGGSES